MSKPLIDRKEVRKAALEKLKKLKLKLVERPTDSDGMELYPEIPSNDISKISDEDLGVLLWKFSAMVEYVGAQLALADSDNVISKANEIAEKTYRCLGSKAKTAKERELESQIHAASKQKAFIHFKRRAQTTLLEAVYQGYEVKRSAISREITRRHPDQYKGQHVNTRD